MRVKNNLIDTFLNKNKEMDKTNKIVKSKMIHEFEDQIQILGMNADDYLKRIKKTKEENV